MVMNSNMQTSAPQNDIPGHHYQPETSDMQQNANINGPISSGCDNQPNKIFNQKGASNPTDDGISAPSTHDHLTDPQEELGKESKPFIDFDFGGADIATGHQQTRTSYPNDANAGVTPDPLPEATDFGYGQDSAASSSYSVDMEANIDSGENPATNQVSIPTTPYKKITNIVVFYSDNTFQTFMPG